MAETVGDLVDRLCIANIRLWHIEDERRAYATTAKEFPGDVTKEQGVELLDKVSQTNKERNSLIDQINAAFRVIIDKAVAKDSTFELTAEELLGTGKNKHYKTEDT